MSHSNFSYLTTNIGVVGLKVWFLVKITCFVKLVFQEIKLCSYMGMKPWMKQFSKLVCQIVCWWFFTQRCVRAIIDQIFIAKHVIKKNLSTLATFKKLDLWVPHQFEKIDLTRHMSICDSLYKHNKLIHFWNDYWTNMTYVLDIVVLTLTLAYRRNQRKKIDLRGW